MPGGTGATTATSTGTWQFQVGGFSSLRARASAGMTGTIIVVITGSTGSMADANVLATITNLATPTPDGSTPTEASTLVGAVASDGSAWTPAANGVKGSITTDELSRVMTSPAPLSVFYTIVSSTTSTNEIELQSAASNAGLTWNNTFYSCLNEGATDTVLYVYDTTGTTTTPSLRDTIPCPKGPNGSRGPYGPVPLRPSATGKGMFVKARDASTTVTFSFLGYWTPK